MLGTKGRSIREELDRRHGLTAAIVQHFLSRPHVWIPIAELAQIGGIGAWRSRVSDARDIVKLDGFEILWNRKNGAESAYMLRPKALGRDAGDQVPAPWNQDRPFAEDFKLTP